MRFFRQMIDDVMSGGVLAGLVAVMLLLQGVAGDYAQAAAAADLGPGTICSVHADGDQLPAPLPDHGKRDCCLAACQLAHQSLLGLSGAGPSGTHRRTVIGAALPVPDDHRPARRIPGLPGSPRGPPVSPA